MRRWWLCRLYRRDQHACRASDETCLRRWTRIRCTDRELGIGPHPGQKQSTRTAIPDTRLIITSTGVTLRYTLLFYLLQEHIIHGLSKLVDITLVQLDHQAHLIGRVCVVKSIVLGDLASLEQFKQGLVESYHTLLG